MNKILTIILIFSINLLLCQRVAINKIDEFTDQKIIKVDASFGKRWKVKDDIAKGIMSVVFLSSKYVEDKNSKFIIHTLNLQSASQICMTDFKSKAILLLEENVKITLNQYSDIECGTNVVSDFLYNGNYEDQLDKLKILSQTSIKKIRVYTFDGYLEYEIKESHKELAKNHFKRLLAEIQINP